MNRALAIVVAVQAVATSAAAPAFGPDLAGWVDPFIGVSRENCIVGPTLPHGSIHPSPQTLDIYDPLDWRYSPGNDGYSPLTEITGFAQLHAQGTGGRSSYGQLLLSPQVGLEIDEEAHRSTKSGEIARIDYYAVTLDRYGIRCEVTPAHHVALYRFTFPPDVEPTLVVNAGRKIVGPSLVRGAISVHAGLGAIAGHGLYTGNWMPGTYPLYYAIEVSEPAASGGAFSEGIVSPGDTVAVRSATEPTASFGAYLRFDRDASRVILVRFAVSFLSVERARHWLDADAGDWDFDRVRREAAERWNEALGAIRIEGATDDQMRIFYTALCRSMTQPRDRTDDMSGFSDGVPVLDDQYTMWDTYRTVWPLMTLIQPSLASRNLRCLLEIHRRFGRVGTAFIWGRSHAVTRQGGTEVDNVIGDAFVKGVRSDDWCALYDVMRHNAEYARPFSYLARGYVAFPGVANSASATLAFALNDFSVSQIARALGRTDEHARYAARSANWANVWSDAALSDGFAGFAAPRDALGVFHGDPTSTAGFYEDNGWTYSFFVPHDVHGMITRMGGSSRFVDRLRHAISAERVSFLNEPAFLLPWLYVYAGRPDLASEEVRRLVETYTLDAYPAQEDGGAVASRHVFAACGLFPNAGQPIYLLHGPLFPHITIALEDGNSLVIEGTGAGPDNPYVQSATLNGEPLDRAWILHGEIARGGRLTFAMGPTPSTWGTEVLPPCPVFANPVNDPICGEAPPMPGLPVVDVAPNPFRIETVFRVGVADSRHPVLLTIHDARGRRVRELLRGSLSPPVETVAWDGRDDRGRAVSPGVYFYALRQDGAFRTGRVVLSR